MATNISPGVYSKIIDLSTYTSAIPGTIGFMCVLSEKGEDNTLKFFKGEIWNDVRKVSIHNFFCFETSK